MDVRYISLLALVALAGCDSEDPVAPYETSIDFHLVATEPRAGSPDMGFDVALGGGDTLELVVPDGVASSGAEAFWAPVMPPLVTSAAGDTIVVTFPHSEYVPEASTGGRAWQSPGDADLAVMAPGPVLRMIDVQVGALRGRALVRAVVTLHTLDLRADRTDGGEKVCVEPGEQVEVLADGRSVHQDDLPGGSYRVPMETWWSLADPGVVAIENTWQNQGAHFATLVGVAEGETVLEVIGDGEGNPRTDEIPVFVREDCEA